MTRLGFIGFKRMGQAIGQGLLHEGEFKLDDFLVCSPSLMRGERTTKFPVAKNNAAVAAAVDILILATKPYQIKSVCQEIATAVQARAQKPVILSVAAGTLIQTIENNLNAHGVPVVRAMTNTPSLIGQGMTPWVANSHVNQAQLLMVQTIFQSIGLEKQLDSEDKLNAATAISGSGPAYFLYMQACMVEEAVRLGFSRAEAALLVNQTALGTAALAETSELTLTELRKQVTSPGGTTEAGLSALMDGRFHQGMRDCIEKAYMRSKALGEEEISPVKKPERMSQNPHAYWTSLGLTQAEYDAIGSENAPKI